MFLGLISLLIAGEPSRVRGTRRGEDLMDGKSESPTLADFPMIQAAHWLTQRWIHPKPQPQQNVVRHDSPMLLQGAVDRWLANKRMIELIANGSWRLNSW
jgi:hypothetical protein